ncbi:hypothetical protein PYW07_016199 [Mythimna separata]|uniref:Carboxylic ester hydrolase n=1 Tax=Mythimna separata TaxID=271217 RepID=A0AAD7YSN7_MYTSE|nr:hypothetical protein PYW07_016199 [Mythimna separata]
MKALCAIILIIVQVVLSHGVQVQVEQGKLEGELLDLVTKDGQYYSFKGIPYAQPPIGKLRFKSPRPAAAWNGVRSAKQHGSVCPQIDILTNMLIPGDEDCLFLNVYSPNLTPKTLLPVLVFIHGGGYKSGSGNVDNYGPDFILRKNMVVVTLNYRLEALGFLSLGTKDVPGNAGLKDQVEALKWVQRNIKHFGGDADRVTIMGQSAGSASVALHISSPMSKGLFRRVISLSGSPFCDWAFAIEPERRAFALGKQLGRELEDPDELLEYLQNLPSAQLVGTSPYLLASEEVNYSVLKMYHYAPVFEKYEGEDSFLTKNAFVNAENVKDVDILFGFTDQEVVVAIPFIVPALLELYNKYPENFVPRKITALTSPYSVLDLSSKIRNYYFGNKSIDVNSIKEFITFLNDATFIYDIIRYFEWLPNIGKGKKYLYQFSGVSKRNVYGSLGAPYGISGAAHLDDLLYLFDAKAFNMTLDKNSREFKLIEQFTTLITDFAKQGNPTPGSSCKITWPAFKRNTMKYVDIGNENLTILSVNDNKNYRFLKHLYNSFDTMSLLNQL